MSADSEEAGADSDSRLRILLPIVLLGTIIGGAIDLVLDAPETLWSAHALFEIVLIAAALGTFSLLWRGWWRASRSLGETLEQLAARQRERDAWRANAESALAGFGRAIESRFEAWGLTPVEREIALALLKGRSHKEIAFATGRSERTVRQHAVAVYEKSRLRGRAELAAFFLEDITLPTTP